MLAWIVGILLIAFGIAGGIGTYIGIGMGDTRGDASPLPTLWGLVPIALGVAVIYWR